MIDSQEIARIVRVVQGAAPHAQVMVSGSFARSAAMDTSDLDLIVVEPGPIARRMESARLRAAVGPISVPVDLVVVSEDAYQEWLATPGMITVEDAGANHPYRTIHFHRGIWRMLAHA